MNRRALPLLVFVLLAPARSPAQEAKSSALKVQTLTPKARLALPYLRVAVSATEPLILARRREPVRFEGDGEKLRADATAKPGFETEVVEGQPVLVELDGEPVAGRPPVRTVVFLRGRAEAGEAPWTVVDLDVLGGKIGNEAVTFVDHDADGTFLTVHRDFLVRKTDGELQPVAPKVILGRAVWDLRGHEVRAEVAFEEDKAFADPEVFPQWPDVVRGLFHINEIRGAMNLAPFGLHPTASAHAMLHVKYCAKNGYFGHVESPGKPGYTPEGAQAGINSIGSGTGSVPGAIDGFLSTLLHRMPLIDPRLCELGIGTDGTMVWIEYVMGAKRPWDHQGPVIFPGPDRSWKEGAFRNENPDPRPAQATGAVGLPITCAWYGVEEVFQGKAVLLDQKKPVPCWRHDSEARELREMSDPEIKACLMPKSTLRYHAYLLELTWLESGRFLKLEYPFHIGKR